jgi:hypothetical protein
MNIRKQLDELVKTSSSIIAKKDMATWKNLINEVWDRMWEEIEGLPHDLDKYPRPTDESMQLLLDTVKQLKEDSIHNWEREYD